MYEPDSSEHAERAVLGCMLLDQFTVDEITEVISSADLYQPYHQAVFDAITRLHSRGEAVDYLSTLGELAQHNGIPSTWKQGPPLTELVQSVATTANAGHYAEIVRKAATWRRLSTLGMQITATCMPDARGYDVDEYLQIVTSDLSAIVDERTHAASADDPITDALNMMEQPIRLRTRWRVLDAAIGGWMPGDLYVAGARPSVGKTTLGCNVALDVARRGFAVDFFSLEMPAYQIATRILCDIASVDMNRVMQRSLRDSDRERMQDAAQQLRALPLTIIDRTGMTLPMIRSHVRASKRQHQLGLVIIDHLTLVRGHSEISKLDRRLQIDHIAQGSKEMARELDVGVLALAQVNRGSEHRSDKRPTLADLRESGGIEMAADTVLLMHREPDPAAVLSPTTNIIVGKSRHGGAVAFDLDLEGKYARLTERPSMEWVREQAAQPTRVPERPVTLDSWLKT